MVVIDEEVELVHETEGTLVEPGYPNEEQPIDRRDVALDAAARLATIGVEHRLLCHVFTRWLRVCSLKPARLLAHRALWEADMLARELGRTEGVSMQSTQLAEAAELHVLSLREQIALSSQGDGEAEKVCERLRTRLRGASAEIERLQAELAQAKEEASVQIAAAREEAAYAKGGSFVASGPFQQTPHERALELRAANVLARADENAAGVTVVARELAALESLSEQIASTVRQKRAAQALQTAEGGGDVVDEEVGEPTAYLQQWMHLANECDAGTPIAAEVAFPPTAATADDDDDGFMGGSREGSPKPGSPSFARAQALKLAESVEDGRVAGMVRRFSQ